MEGQGETVSAFLIKNVPDDREILQDFVEGTLCVDVLSIEFSPLSKEIVLVEIDKELDLKDVTDFLKNDEELLEGRTGPLEILDAGKVQDSVIVKNVDVEVLTLQWLQLYMESIFADGNSVVADCKFIPNHEKIALVVFNNHELVPDILMEEVQVPINSVASYHINVKPFYSLFYEISQTVPQTQTFVRNEDEVFLFQETKRPSSDSYPYFYQAGDENLDTENEENEISDEWKEEEEEVKDVPKFKWKLLQNEVEKYKIAYDVIMDYRKKDQTLFIRGREATVHKSKIYVLGLLSNINKVTLDLCIEKTALFKRDRVKDLLDRFSKDEHEQKFVYKIEENSLQVYSIFDAEIYSDLLKERFLYVQSIELSSDIPPQKIREWVNYCQNDFLVSIACEDFSELTVTGVKEDVTLVVSEITTNLKEFTWDTETLTLKDEKATYVKKYFNLSELRKVFKNAEVVQFDDQNDSEITIHFKFQKISNSVLQQELIEFRESIKINKVDFNKFDKQDLSFIYKNLREDNIFLKEFEKENVCCILVNNVLESTSERMPAMESHQLSDHQQMMPENPNIPNKFFFGTSGVVKILSSENIIQENSQVLVCGIHKSMNLKKTRVSQAFEQHYPALQDEIRSFPFTPQGVYFAESRLKVNTACEAIAFVILKEWTNESSKDTLLNIIYEILDTANQKGFKSVSIPPLGIGRALKYPCDITAQGIINAIDLFLQNGSKQVTLDCIHLLAQEEIFFSEIIKAAKSVSTLKNAAPNIVDKDTKNPNKKPDKNPKAPSKVDIKKIVDREVKAPSVVIVKRSSNDIVSKFVSKLKSLWLYVDHFEPGKLFCWPPQFMTEVKKMSMKINVKVDKIWNSTTGEHMCRIKGKLDNVKEMKDELIKKTLAVDQSYKKKELFSSSAPPRGTVEFLKYAIDCKINLPSYWKYKSDLDKSFQLVKVNTECFKEIEQLVYSTWRKDLVGRGSDARNIAASNLKVLKIERVENPSKFEDYCRLRLNILRKVIKSGGSCKDVSNLPNSKGPARTMLNLPNLMQKELLHEINEFYLFHSTNRKAALKICQEGFDPRLSSGKAMFGNGVYFAESSTKADQYADNPDNRQQNGTELTMFFSRVVLGHVFLCDDKHESVRSKECKKLSRPPCLKCFKDRCYCREAQRHHSVLGDGIWLFREFVVYEEDQSYPEYLITYCRE